MPKSSGFYSNKEGKLLYAPTAVHFADGAVIKVSQKDTYTFPVNDWTFFESEAEARTAFDLPAASLSTPGLAASNPLANKLDTEAQRAERQADRQARIARKDPAKAEKLQAALTAGAKVQTPAASNRANRTARFPSEAALAKAKAAKSQSAS